VKAGWLRDSREWSLRLSHSHPGSSMYFGLVHAVSVFIAWKFAFYRVIHPVPHLLLMPCRVKGFQGSFLYKRDGRPFDMSSTSPGGGILGSRAVWGFVGLVAYTVQDWPVSTGLLGVVVEAIIWNVGGGAIPLVCASGLSSALLLFVV
jgi:hypothetical protein